MIITGLMMVFAGCSVTQIADMVEELTEPEYTTTQTSVSTEAIQSENNQYESFDMTQIPDYQGTDVIIINNDEPYFTDAEKQYNGTYINLSELDSLGRCGVAMTCVGQETEPTEERGRAEGTARAGRKMC